MKRYYRGNIRHFEDQLIAIIDRKKTNPHSSHEKGLSFSFFPLVLAWHIDPAKLERLLAEPTPTLPSSEESSKKGKGRMVHGVRGRFSKVPRFGRYRSNGTVAM